MELPLFSGITDTISAFKASSQKMTATEAAALEIARSATDRTDQLGFKKPVKRVPKRTPNELEGLKSLLAESGHGVDDDSASRIADRLQAEMTRGRFWVQAGISLLVVLFCVAILWSGQGNETLQKAVIGLLGTVVGFWLR